jgi:glycosyltransferase involved in cell wall biosynthesis
MKKIKVVWICHFSNKEIRNKIPLSRLLFRTAIRKFLSKKGDLYHDFAPWVTNLAIEFEKFEQIELHILSPHIGLSKLMHSFQIRNINYHFFKPDVFDFIDYPLSKIFKFNKKYYLNRYLVRRFVDDIKPDIINLIGSENPYYSISVLDLKGIPIFVSLQTVYTNPLRKQLSGECIELNWNVEMKIHKRFTYFGASGRKHRDLLLANNPKAIVFKMLFPIQKPPNITEPSKVYDFVFFAASVNQKKGVEDAIKAFGLVKKQNKNISLNICGKCKTDYRIKLNTIIEKHDLTDNIYFTDYFTNHNDLHLQLKKAKYALLPYKLDVISSAIIEAILLELPVISYKTTGTPYLNKDGETVLLADIGDTQKLAENMLRLINSPKLAEQLKRDAKAFVERDFDNTASATRLVNNYRAVIDHYHNNTPIPEEQLFSTEEFPLY